MIGEKLQWLRTFFKKGGKAIHAQGTLNIEDKHYV